MGTVYLARQISLDRHVAAKVMNPQWAKGPAFMVRFTREPTQPPGSCITASSRRGWRNAVSISSAWSMWTDELQD
jgi:hypothetical protein